MALLALEKCLRANFAELQKWLNGPYKEQLKAEILRELREDKRDCSSQDKL